MNIKQIKDVIDELIYESVVGKNPFKNGDLVKLRPDVVGRFGKRVPAHAGFSRTQQSWMKTLEDLIDKTGKVERVSSDSKHITVKYPQSWTSKDEYDRPYTINSIGIDYTELVPANKPEGGEVLNQEPMKEAEGYYPYIKPPIKTNWQRDPNIGKTAIMKIDKSRGEHNKFKKLRAGDEVTIVDSFTDKESTPPKKYYMITINAYKIKHRIVVSPEEIDIRDTQNPEIKEVNYTTDKSTGKPIIAQGAPGSVMRFASENPHIIQLMRDWVKDILPNKVEMDEDEIDELSDEKILRFVQKNYEGGIRQFMIDSDSEPDVPVGYKDNIEQTSEGFGYVSDKDRAKDPKSIKLPGGGTEHWRIKYQSASDLKKHGNTEKSKVSESQISVNEVKNVIQELIKEMWIGWEEGKNVDEKKEKENPFEKDRREKEEHDVLRKVFKQVRPVGGTNDEKSFAAESNKLKKKVVKEIENPEKSYIIWGMSGPAESYYVNSPTQGERMVQFGQSMATKFHSEQDVRNKIIQLRQKYKGITKWDFEIVPTETSWQDAWKHTKNYKVGHQVFKPVKKGDEYVVRWTTNGKRDEGKTYYTDDRKDADDTYLVMLKQAEELNRQGK